MAEEGKEGKEGTPSTFLDEIEKNKLREALEQQREFRRQAQVCTQCPKLISEFTLA